jgi:uncharacterized cupredoxin-like copper-binding protein
MPRLHAVSLVAVVLLASLFVDGRALVAAQDPDYAGHPLVGTWTLMVEGAQPEMVTFSDSGGYIDVNSEGTVFLGVWEPTGENTANLTITIYDVEGSYQVFMSIEVADDGQSFTASFTYELIDPETDSGTGEYGPRTATGTRMSARGPATPVGSFEDFVSQPEDTPVASPVADRPVNVIQITLGDLNLMVEADQLPLTAGQEYTFIATNQGVLDHELVIEPAGSSNESLQAGDREAEFEHIAPGTSAELTWTFEEPGMYQFACHVPGHFEVGEVLEFEVVAP